jgi:hypothetical protein
LNPPAGYSLNFLIWVYIILFWLASNSKWEALNIKLEEQNIFETAQGIAIVSKSLLQASYKRPDYLFFKNEFKIYFLLFDF